jgi:mannitol-specific phosphotransferase system IIBC component
MFAILNNILSLVTANLDGGAVSDIFLKKTSHVTTCPMHQLSNIDKKEHTFRIKAKENNRNFYMQADSENTQHEWMQAICFAKAAGRDGENSQACVIQ